MTQEASLIRSAMYTITRWIRPNRKNKNSKSFKEECFYVTYTSC